ncbi:MAG: aspartate/glutamate racemase family protein [Elusimicrobiota bacterium]
MKEKIIGILGGMGPEATIDLFRKIVKQSPAKRDQDHFRIIIDNNPKIPDRSKAILQKGESPLHEMIATAKNLERAGANFIIMPCNTAHFFYNDLQKKINIPIIHMIKETALYIHKVYPNIQRISLFATKGTYKTGLYQTFLNKGNIETLIPTQDEQNKIMNIIYGIKAGNRLDLLKRDILKLAENQIAKNTQGIIAGCTEIPLILKNGDIDIPIIDPTLILAEKAIERAKRID